MDCCVFLYLQALGALLALDVPVRDNKGFAFRCTLLQQLLREPVLLPLWRQLLNSGGQAAVGMDVVSLLGNALVLVLQVGAALAPRACVCR